jgi:heat shock protein HslJ
MRKQLSVSVTALAAVLALAACGSDNSGSAGAAAGPTRTALPLTGVHWSLDSVTVDGKKSAAPAGAYVEITPKGRAEGDSGCNHFGADATVKGDTVTVGEIVQTDMACEKNIMAFENALGAAFSGKLKAKLSDGTLALTTEKGDAIALTSERPAPLVGTTWSVNSLVSGETASSLPAGAQKKAHLTFAKDGTVRGSLGCNTFTGTAKISGSKITFGSLATTRRQCPGPEMNLERELIKVLDGTVTYELRHRGLSLTAVDGKGIAATATTPAAQK